MKNRFKFGVAVFERYNTDEWEFTKFIENTDKLLKICEGADENQ